MTNKNEKSLAQKNDEQIRRDGHANNSKANKAVRSSYERVINSMFGNWDLYAECFKDFADITPATTCEDFKAYFNNAIEKADMITEKGIIINYAETIQKAVPAAWSFKTVDGKTVKDKKLYDAVPAVKRPSTKVLDKYSSSNIFDILYQAVFFEGKAMKLSDLKDEELKARAIVRLEAAIAA